MRVGAVAVGSVMPTAMMGGRRLGLRWGWDGVEGVAGGRGVGVEVWVGVGGWLWVGLGFGFGLVVGLILGLGLLAVLHPVPNRQRSRAAEEMGDELVCRVVAARVGKGKPEGSRLVAAAGGALGRHVFRGLVGMRRLRLGR